MSESLSNPVLSSKALLKFRVYEVIERMVRCDNLLRSWENSPGASIPLILNRHLQERLARLKQKWIEEKELYQVLFSDSLDADLVSLDALAQRTTENYGELCQLTGVLAHGFQGTALPEAQLFLDEVATGIRQSLPNLVPSAILLHAEGVLSGSGSSEAKITDRIILESLSMIQKENPLGWYALLRESVRCMVSQHEKFTELRFEIPSQALEALLLVRLLGPAAYFGLVLEAIVGQNVDFLRSIEPLLFQGLQSYQLSDKTILRVHEACQDVFAGLATETLIPDVSKVLQAIDGVMTEQNAFLPSSFERAIESQNRLEEGILLSALGPDATTIHETHERLSREEGQESQSIYHLIAQVAETPNTVREIMNAGWLHKVERTSIWLYTIFNSPEFDGFERFANWIERQDHLLLKSIETSEVHRVLLCGVSR